jgi:hypothetical protein
MRASLFDIAEVRITFIWEDVRCQIKTGKHPL